MSEMCQDFWLPNLLFLRPFNLCIWLALCLVWRGWHFDCWYFFVSLGKHEEIFQIFFFLSLEGQKGEKLGRISRIEFQDNQSEKKGHIIEWKLSSSRIRNEVSSTRSDVTFSFFFSGFKERFFKIFFSLHKKRVLYETIYSSQDDYLRLSEVRKSISVSLSESIERGKGFSLKRRKKSSSRRLLETRVKRIDYNEKGKISQSVKSLFSQELLREEKVH